MSPVRRRRVQQRVYLAVPPPLRLALVLGAILSLLAAAAGAPPARAQVELTVDRVMVRGPVRAPVTIVEFSDYQ